MRGRILELLAILTSDAENSRDDAEFLREVVAGENEEVTLAEAQGIVSCAESLYDRVESLLGYARDLEFACLDRDEDDERAQEE